MSSQVDYKSFGKNESCVEEGCRSRKWYIEDGKKFCRRGHEQTGFLLTQRDEDDFGNEGQRTKKQREEKTREVTTLTGRQAQELFLECYQLILWKQCSWLVSVKGFPKELETVVRDLWGLRLKLFHPENEKDGYDSGNSVMGFSSSEDDTASDATSGRSLWSGTSGTSVIQKKRSMPKLVETLAFCYLGTLLLRLPTSLGDIFRWASMGEIVFTRAVSRISDVCLFILLLMRN